MLSFVINIITHDSHGYNIKQNDESKCPDGSTTCTQEGEHPSNTGEVPKQDRTVQLPGVRLQSILAKVEVNERVLLQADHQR